MKALYNGRQPPGPAAIGGMEVAHGRSHVTQPRRPQSAGPFAAGAVGANPGRGRAGMVRPGFAMATRARLLPGEGSTLRRATGSPPGDGAMSPTYQSALAKQGEDDPDAGGWRDESSGDDAHAEMQPERGPYAAREVYGV